MNLKVYRQAASDIVHIVSLAALFTAMAIVLGRPEVHEYLFDIGKMRDALQYGHGGSGPLLSAILFVLLWGGLIAAGIPRLWASAVGGIIYGAFLGTLVSLLASLLGAAVVFGAGTSVLAGVVEHRMGGAMMLWRDRFRENAFWWTLYGRLFPFSNSTLMSLLCGSCKVPFRDFLLGSLLGFVPLAAVFATFGSGGGRGNLWQIGLATALLVLSVFSRRLLCRWFPVREGSTWGQ